MAGNLKMEDTNKNTVTITKNGFTHSDGNGISFTRDEKGHIIKAEETAKDKTLISSLTYSYDENDNLISITDKAERTSKPELLFTHTTK